MNKQDLSLHESDQATNDLVSKDLHGNQLDHFYAIILSRGTGTRLWPLSRGLSPKQILRLFGTDILIRQTITQLTKLVEEERIGVDIQC